ncbi:molybdate ABC transporter substrate-binding protein [Arthrobacter castelli]|uniref:molybdate ABC transporter substrate-binding protein n=1 Tax=Arthrobacter castelli TaxID=271431 RepID=UPI000424B189|nr:molybdate ABC transporter substrate-binding protein [Arthrobacter castelli]
MRRRQGGRWRALPRRAVVVAAVAMALASCGPAGQNPPSSSSTDPEPEQMAGNVSGHVTVFAAASLSEAFTAIGKDFEAEHPGVDVQFNFAGSSTLARQLERGAPADVFASANQQQMRTVVDAGVVTDPAVFAHNKLRIVTPAGNPAGVDGLRDFAQEELTIALCVEQVPCGAAAREAFAAAGVEPAPDTLEQDVKAVLTKVSLGEADAGLVYVTDAATAGDEVEDFGFEASDAAVNDYHIAVLNQAPHRQAAAAFVDFVQSRQGQQTLADFGFMAGGS